ncbi:MAG: ABC transporter ATP-binding protein [Planctomycetota bacterium]
MSDIAIRVENLSKRYRIGGKQPYHRFSEQLTRIGESVISWPARLLRGSAVAAQHEAAKSEEEFWALKDVSFDVKNGEVVGIIGPNGAGKSTLLKILSRITEPTAGRIGVRGRIGSLLEVGTGFHPELTGRENVYMNGTMLGMTKREIACRFEEIVDFSGVEKFLDTPIKRYSSGMQVRLGFAVAAHLEPEVLIVDEVLAVGDAEFQRNCLGKMRDVASEGRTVLFVSHNMTAVRLLCGRCVWLADGTVRGFSDTLSVVTSYLSESGGTSSASAEVCLKQWPIRRGNGEAQIVAARLLGPDHRPTTRLQRLRPFTLEFDLESTGTSEINLSAICTTADDGLKVLQLAHQDTQGCMPGVLAGKHTVRIAVEALPLQCGHYQWTLSVHTNALAPIDVVSEVLSFAVDDDLSVSTRPYRSTRENGLCSLIAHWTLSSQER